MAILLEGEIKIGHREFGTYCKMPHWHCNGSSGSHSVAGALVSCPSVSVQDSSALIGWAKGDPTPRHAEKLISISVGLPGFYTGLCMQLFMCNS